MKKYFYLLVSLVVAIVLTASCRENEISSEVVSKVTHKESTIFYTSICPYDSDEVSTKTFLNNEAKLRWNAGDLVSIFDGNTGNRQFKFAGTEGETDGPLTFQGGASSGTALTGSKIFAIYPYHSQNTISVSGDISTIYPREQTYVPGSFGSGANIMMAVSEAGNNNLLFKNVCGYIKLSVKGTKTITAIRIKGNNNEKISGRMTISANPGGSPAPFTVTMDDDATKEIVLSLGDNGIQLTSTATVFYVALPPTTFSNGFTVEIYDIDGKYMSKSKGSSFSIISNRIQPFTEFEYAPTHNLGLPASNFVNNGTKYSMYQIDEDDADITYSGYEQFYTSSSPASSTYTFMIGAFDFYGSIFSVYEGVRKDALTGDIFTISYYTNLHPSISVDVKVLRKTSTRLWLFQELSSMGIIVKNVSL